MYYDTNKLNSLKLIIKGNTVLLNQINFLKITHSLFKSYILGEINFNDINGINENLNTYDEIQLLSIDSDYNLYQDNFVITNIEVNTKTMPIVQIEFIDKITYNLLNDYKSKGYKGDFKSIIEKDYKSLIIKDIKYSSINPNPYTYLSTNLSINSFKVLKKLSEENNYFIFQDRNKYNFLNIKDFLQNIKDYKFYYKNDNELYKYNVYDYNLTVNNNLLDPISNISKFNYTDKDFKKREKMLIENDKLPLGAKDVKLNEQKTKEEYVSNYDFNNNINSKKFKNTQNYLKSLELEILTRGSNNYNLGEVVNFELNNWQLGFLPNKSAYGKYIITEIVDFIQPPFFLNRLVLNRGEMLF